MKYCFFIFALIIILTACTHNTKPEKKFNAIPYEKRILIAVGDLQNRTGDADYDSILDPLTGIFINELQKTSCFRLVERQRLKSLLEEMKLSFSGLTDPAASKQVGKLLGVDAFIFVDLSAVDYNNDKNEVGDHIEKGDETFIVRSDARLVAVETGEIYASSAYSVTMENSYSKVGSILKGQKADKKAFVEEAMEQSVEYLAQDIAGQVSRNGVTGNTNN